MQKLYHISNNCVQFHNQLFLLNGKITKNC